jgi:hypothetical protein
LSRCFDDFSSHWRGGKLFNAPVGINAYGST